MKKRKVLLIGWDSCEWKVVNDLMAKGLMPTLQKFLSEASSGKFATLEPPVSPILWTSMATGKRMEHHGIHGFLEPDPNPNSPTGIRAVSVTSRKVKAIWNMLNQKGYSTNVIGWWPSHPAEPVNGLMVSNFYHLDKPAKAEEWELPEGTVHPVELSETFKDLRVSGNEITAAHILPFIPEVMKVNQEEDKIVSFVIGTLAHTSTVHNAITWALDNRPADFNAVYYEGLDHFSHAAMKFHPPKRDSVDGQKYDFYKHVVTGAYRFHDMMLETLLKQVDEDTTVIICSDHGFHPDHLRPVVIPKEPSGPTVEHSPYGFIAIKGPGIKKGHTFHGASVIDLCPTLLHLYDLPIGKDMVGRPLLQIYEQPEKVEYIDSWENFHEGYSGQHDPEKVQDTYAEASAMEQLIELGYIENPSEDKTLNIRKVTEEADYMMGRNYLEQSKFELAIPLFEKLAAANNYEARFSNRLFSCYVSTGKLSKAKELIEKQKSAEGSSEPGVLLAEGLIATAMNDPYLASDKFNKAIQNGMGNSSTYYLIGNSYLAMGMKKEAEKMFRKSLELDFENNSALIGLGYIFELDKKYEEALDFYFQITDRILYYPRAHARIGKCFYELGLYDQCANAYEMVLISAPRDLKTRKQLAHIYKDKLNNQAKAEGHLKLIEKYFRGDIAVVTGLPGSGQSLLLDLMIKAGLPVFYDSIEAPDPAYKFFRYGHSAVFKLGKDKKVLDGADDMILRVMPKQIVQLPTHFNYKYIVVNREEAEIQQFLQKGTQFANKGAYDPKMGEDLKQNKMIISKLVEDTPENLVLTLEFREICDHPSKTLNQICSFLGLPPVDFTADKDTVKDLLTSLY